MENAKLDKLKEEIKQKQVNAVKTIVKETFRKIEALEKTKNDIQNKLKILKHDLFDLKDGRLDRILERQTMDASIKSLSVLTVEKSGKDNSNSPWYTPYKVTFLDTFNHDKDPENASISTVELNNSIVKLNAAGTYQIDSEMKYL